ncbi:MAG TPA: histidine kinase dimerization/phospho-acceptor domain-containing protein, partial [Demequina sp.]|nr:histidine kinase dimerization/phospho-acceptor domain-containing protein [Demequina sp.]
MRRRVLGATLSALAVAMVLLGIPLGVFAFQLVRDDALRDLDSRTAAAARSIEARYDSGETIDESILDNFLGTASGAPRHIAVRLPDGTEITAGEEPQPSFRGSAVTDSDIIVLVSIARADVFWEAARAVGLVLVVGGVAVLAGAVMASWQANRLAAPLVYLAASAEQIGSGQTRPLIELSGVEEIDLVAEELVRSADRMAARLSAERQFAADASHQLRTPLTALTMRLEEISASTTQDEVRVEAEASLEQVDRLVGVVDELLGR